MKTVLITGGSGGIGAECSSLFAEKGYKVYELSRRGKGGENVTHITCDITAEDEIEKAVERIVSEVGSIDILVNNAGGGISGAVEFTKTNDAEKLFKLNFFGTFQTIKAVIPVMREKGGVIVNVSSVAAPVAIPFQAFYSATKASINSLTLALRNELKPFGIKVCAVMPGDTKTGFTSSREKSTIGDDLYKGAISKAVAVMEKDEQNGMKPSVVAKVIYRAATRKNPRCFYTVGLTYKLICFLIKILPTRFTNYIVGKIY